MHHTLPNRIREHVGLILAAGASARMGSPKSLLTYPDGTRLAEDQVRRMRSGGCRDVWMVVGAKAEAILEQLPDLPCAFNPDWETGRWSSVQVGLLSAGTARGYLVLPVDTAGVRPETIATLLQVADPSEAMALRPSYQGRPGRLLWISKTLRDQFLSAANPRDKRLDHWVTPYQEILPVDDPAILNNINTPQEWTRYLDGLRIEDCRLKIAD